jgi:formate dehydrogenase subunit delta
MLTRELEHLIKMINQIADNIAIGDDDAIIAAKVTEHLQLFWAPPMKKKIINYAANDGEKLNVVAKVAVSQL